MEKWLNKNAVVTGSSSGIGLAILKELLKEGINVIGLVRHVEKFDSIIENVKNSAGKLLVHQCDVSNPHSVKNAFNWIEENVGAVDVLINCAGIFRFISFNNELKETIDVNFMGTVYCTRKAYESMMKYENFGLIVNINSVGGHYVKERIS